MARPPPRRTGRGAQPAAAAAPAPETSVVPTEGPRFVAPAEMGFPDVMDQLAELKPQCEAIDFSTRDGYESGKGAIQQCTKLRSAIDKKRKELKAPALEWNRKVEDKAKELVGLIEDLEKPLRDRKLAVDKADEARRKEEERKAREAEEARLRAEREAADKARRAAEEERQRLEQKQAEMEKMEAAWAKKHGQEPPTSEEAKQEPKGPPPRRTGPGAESIPPVLDPTPAPAPADEPPLEQGQAVPQDLNWPLNKCLASGCTLHLEHHGSAIQARILGPKREWHGTGNIATQALGLALERWQKGEG